MTKKLMYLTENIDELERVENQLESAGIQRSHLHILSDDDQAIEEHGLPPVSEWSKRDLLRSGLLGASLGIALASLVVVFAYVSGVEASVQWALVGFVCLAIVGFSTWEGGLIGISKINHDYEKWEQSVKNGSHLLVIDCDDDEEPIARHTLEEYPALKLVA